MSAPADVPGLVETVEGHGETTLVVEPARIVEACLHLRDEQGYTFLSDVSPTDYLGWGETPVAGYIGTPDGRDMHSPGSQGHARVPAAKPKRFSVSYHLLRLGADPARVRVQAWLDDGDEIDPWSRSGPRPTGTSAKRGTCSGSASAAIPTSSGS